MRRLWFCLSLLVLFATFAARAAVPATSPATATRPGINPTARMNFRFQAATIDEILNEMSQRFGFIIVQSVNISQRITINVPNPVDADDAVRLINSALYSLQYGMIETRTGTGDEAKTVLRVVPLIDRRLANIPVRTGADPKDIPIEDAIVTQIIPLKNIDAANLAPLVSDGGTSIDTTHNALIITDTSAKINRIAQIIQKLDQPGNVKTVTQYRQLKFTNAADAVRLINAMFTPNPADAPKIPADAAAATQPARLYSDFDVRTNTVIITGPAEQVKQALELIDRVEAQTATAPVFLIHESRTPESIQPVLERIFGTTTTAPATTATAPGR
jgi:type II secretory pathway component GspD/PulD (secretin)